jgi:hypothetical protein
MIAGRIETNRAKLDSPNKPIGIVRDPDPGPLTGRYVYLFATEIDNADVLKGTVSMCIDRRKFKLFGVPHRTRKMR